MDEPRRIEQRDVEEPLKSYRTILQQEILQAEQEIRRPGLGLFVSGLLAGFGVGMSLFLMALWPQCGHCPPMCSRKQSPCC